MKTLCDVMAPEVDLTVMVPGNRVNREAATRPGAPQAVVPLGLQPASTPWCKAANRISLNLDTRLRARWDPGMPYLPLIVGLLSSRAARKAVRDADVIDLQWSDSIRLVRLLRRMNPRARIVGTFHDVMSQSYSREPQEAPRDRRYWQGVARRSRRHERRMVSALDSVLVFSDKDVRLLGSPHNCAIVRPPVAGPEHEQHQPLDPSHPVVLVVSYLARDENNKAALWVLRDVWPGVRERVPHARLRLVGGGATAELTAGAASDTSVELVGFVEDLAREYAEASVALVPVLQGAGVKFKTVEALLHGVPVVTTTVGAEGVGGDTLFAAVADDAATLVRLLGEVLAAPERHQRSADAAQVWAAEEFSRDRFRETVRRAWEA